MAAWAGGDRSKARGRSTCSPTSRCCEGPASFGSARSSPSPCRSGRAGRSPMLAATTQTSWRPGPPRSVPERGRHRVHVIQGVTQGAALSHALYEDGMSNEHASGDPLGDAGTSANAVTALRDGRWSAVLLDVARHRGVDSLPEGAAIGPEELDDVLDVQGVEVGTGDILVIRTGSVGDAVRNGALPFETLPMASPGLSVRRASWLVEYDFAAVAPDNLAVETTVGEAEGDDAPPHDLPAGCGIPSASCSTSTSWRTSWPPRVAAISFSWRRLYLYLLRVAASGPVKPLTIL